MARLSDYFSTFTMHERVLYGHVTDERKSVVIINDRSRCRTREMQIIRDTLNAALEREKGTDNGKAE